MPQKRMERLRTTKSPNLSMILSWPSLFPVTLTGRSEINAGKNVTDMMNKKINELVNTITLERPDMVYRKIEAENDLIAEILSHGNETGEFDINNIIGTARTIHTSLVIFNVPIFMSLYSLEQFEEKAVSIVELIVNGIAKRH